MVGPMSLKMRRSSRQDLANTGVIGEDRTAYYEAACNKCGLRGHVRGVRRHAVRPECCMSCSKNAYNTPNVSLVADIFIY